MFHPFSFSQLVIIIPSSCSSKPETTPWAYFADRASWDCSRLAALSARACFSLIWTEQNAKSGVWVITKPSKAEELGLDFRKVFGILKLGLHVAHRLDAFSQRNPEITSCKCSMYTQEWKCFFDNCLARVQLGVKYLFKRLLGMASGSISGTPAFLVLTLWASPFRSAGVTPSASSRSLDPEPRSSSHSRSMPSRPPSTSMRARWFKSTVDDLLSKVKFTVLGVE